MIAPVAVLDANVLYPSLVRNLLMYCATEGLIAARWTAAIHEEWICNLLEDRSELSKERLHRTRRLMEQAVPDAEVTGYESYIAGLQLPDPEDRHVLAAAIQAEAEIVVTFNLKDFPKTILAEHGLEALTPDDLLCRLLESRQEATLEVLEKLRTSFHNLPYDQPQFQERLNAVGLTQLVRQLQAL